MRALVLVMYNLNTIFELPSFSHFGNMIGLEKLTRISCRWQTRTTRCITSNVPHTNR